MAEVAEASWRCFRLRIAMVRVSALFALGATACEVATAGTFANHYVDGTVKAVGKDGKCQTAQGPRVLASGRTLPIGIAVDSSLVWWVEYNAGSVMRVAK
jgi:hypothetical protein